MKKNTKMLKKKFKIYDPKIKEECAVFGISNNQDASALTALGLHALQHRGQEGCGIVSYDGNKYYSEKRYGLVGDNFNNEKVLKKTSAPFRVRGDFDGSARILAGTDQAGAGFDTGRNLFRHQIGCAHQLQSDPRAQRQTYFL